MTYAYDPQLRSAALARGAERVDLEDLVAARALERELCPLPVPEEGIDVTDLDVESGGLRVPVRLYLPARVPPRAWILDIHGGGFLLGGLHTDDQRCRELVGALGVGVVNVDYRLAPEHAHPAALHDCAAALAWLRDARAAYGDASALIAVRGVSAGGALAAALTLWERDHSRTSLSFQFLGVPVLDDRLETASMRNLTESVGWDRLRADYAWRAFLGGGSADQYAAPARALDLSGLPPAYVTAMEFDVLRDEAIEYACRLIAADVSVELHVFRGTYHGSFLADARVSSRELGEELDVWRESPLLRPEWSE